MLPVVAAPATSLFSNPLNEDYGCLTRIYSCYMHSVKGMVDLFRACGLTMTASVFGALAAEPLSSIGHGLMSPYGWNTECSYYNLNPSILTSEELDKNPALLIHGKGDNQSAWFDLAPKLTMPAFTVNLPDQGPIGERDRQIIHDKIEAIKELYLRRGRGDIKVHLVGYSRGSQAAYSAAIDRLDIDRLIRIGHPTLPEELNNRVQALVYEIDARWDVLVDERSLLPSHQHVELNCGHLGLLSSDSMHQAVIRECR